MKFMFSFGLLVLPLFMLVCVQIIRQNEDLRASIMGKFLEGLFMLMALACIGTAVYLISTI